VAAMLSPCFSPATGGPLVSPGGGGGSATPTVGMLPAKIEVDSAHISATAIANVFMDLAPFEVEKDAEIST
jgi:hypothetical protein